jgi:endonuclease/exonuclease/phosphatase (EEP) superfamily protein YafD
VRAALLALSCIACGAPRGVAPSEPELTVMTYNVNFGLAGDEETLAAIGRQPADVVLLQETNEAWESAIRERYTALYSHMRFFPTDRLPAGGMAILSAHPIRRVRRSPSAVGWFFAASAIVDLPSGPVQVVNVHLKPQIDDRGSFIGGRYATPPERAREMRAHVRRLVDPSLPVIIAGDFNENERGGLEELETRGFRSALVEHEPHATTWRWSAMMMQMELRLDHVAYRPDRLTCLDAHTIEAGRSDHIPVIASFVRSEARVPNGRSMLSYFVR